MKKEKYHIILTWMLMLCFIAGQYMVYAHQHSSNVRSGKIIVHESHAQPKHTITDNCRLCDAMHHNGMMVTSNAYFAPVVITPYFYKVVHHNFISMALVLSAGRSPPLA